VGDQAWRARVSQLWLRAACARWRAARRSPVADQVGQRQRFEATGSLVDAAALRLPEQRARLITLEQVLDGH
jgi:hypothetical protein